MKNYLFIIGLLAIGLLTSCSGDSNAAKATVGEAKKVASPAAASSLMVNTAGSTINWTGSKPTGKHSGTIGISKGLVELEGGDLSGGKFTLDMNSITVTDLEGDSKANLENHLKGMTDENKDHFFDVRTYPTSTFEITKVAKLANDPAASHLVYGNLQIKDVTKEVGFKAKIENTNGKLSITTPPFTIDRSEFNVKYGSSKFFPELKDKIIHDDIELQISLTTM